MQLPAKWNLLFPWLGTAGPLLMERCFSDPEKISQTKHVLLLRKRLICSSPTGVVLVEIGTNGMGELMLKDTLKYRLLHCLSPVTAEGKDQGQRKRPSNSFARWGVGGWLAARGTFTP